MRAHKRGKATGNANRIQWRITTAPERSNRKKISNKMNFIASKRNEGANAKNYTHTQSKRRMI